MYFTVLVGLYADGTIRTIVYGEGLNHTLVMRGWSGNETIWGEVHFTGKKVTLKLKIKTRLLSSSPSFHHHSGCRYGCDRSVPAGCHDLPLSNHCWGQYDTCCLSGILKAHILV